MTIFKTLWRWFNNSLIFSAPLVDLFVRYWVASAFFYSGLTKINTWSSTVFLFKHEYQVPLLSPEVAAYLGTAAELTLPVLLLLGLGGRLAPFALFIFNIIAVISYPYLHTDAGAVALKDHIYWGMLLAMLCAYGYNKLSLDYIIRRLWQKKRNSA